MNLYVYNGSPRLLPDPSRRRHERDRFCGKRISARSHCKISSCRVHSQNPMLIFHASHFRFCSCNYNINFNSLNALCVLYFASASLLVIWCDQHLFKYFDVVAYFEQATNSSIQKQGSTIQHERYYGRRPQGECTHSLILRNKSNV